MKIDNFALVMFQNCPAKFNLRIMEGWTSRRKSGALGFGGALHEGLATWYRTQDPNKAIKAVGDAWPMNLPIDDWRTKEKCLSTMLEYIKRYPGEQFAVLGAPDNPMVEVTFTIDTGMFLSCVECQAPWVGELGIGMCQRCGKPLEPIEYGGIFDGIVQYGADIFVLEHKTTSQLGQYYFDQFKPNNQVTGYVWGARKLSGQNVTGAIINAIGIYKSSATRFERQITSRNDQNIDEWLENVRNTCEMIRECQIRQHWPMFTGSCTMYGKCEYHQIHTLNSFKERQKLLEQDYVKDEWKYEERAGVKNE